MKFLFPYHKVERNSSVVLYGIGNVGKQFYRQLFQTGYCNIVGWSDQVVQGYTELQGKLIPAEKINECDFDYVVIAVAAYDAAQEITENLIRMGIEPSRIVWEDNYELHDVEWPDDTDYFLQNADFLLEIMNIFCRNKQQFGEGRFYQSYPMLGLKGKRPTQERIENYGLRELLKHHMNVLDIGCNCGFLDLQIADMVHTVTGLELNSDLVQIAEMTRQYLKKDNCTFLEKDFHAWNTKIKYDMVFAFAVFHWIHLDPDAMADRLVGLVKEDGFLLMESHNIFSKDRLADFDLCIECLKERGMYVVRQGMICDDGIIVRKFELLRIAKNNGK